MGLRGHRVVGADSTRPSGAGIGLELWADPGSRSDVPGVPSGMHPGMPGKRPAPTEFRHGYSLAPVRSVGYRGKRSRRGMCIARCRPALGVSPRDGDKAWQNSRISQDPPHCDRSCPREFETSPQPEQGSRRRRGTLPVATPGIRSG